MAGRKVTRDDLRAAAEKYKNWGKWGPDDEIGTLNYTSPQDIVAAAQRQDQLSGARPRESCFM